MRDAKPTGTRYSAHPLYRDEVLAILGSCPDTWLGLRKRALVAVLYRCGLRCNEALQLDLHDVRLDAPATVRVRYPKGHLRGAPPREIGLDVRTAEILGEWLKARGDAPGALFVTATGARCLPSWVRSTMGRLGRRAGLQRRVHAHALRHTFARELYAEKVGMVEIQLALGHSDLGTTQRYLASIGANEVVAATGARIW